MYYSTMDLQHKTTKQKKRIFQYRVTIVTFN